MERFLTKIVPFEYTIKAIKRGSVLELLALIFNVVCFMPMTMTLCYLGMRKRHAFLFSVLFSASIEVFQLFSCWGGFDFMDIVENGFGALLGVLTFEFFCIRLNKWVQRSCFLVLLGILIPLDIYAIINTIQNFPE
jgi:glycopeptide antibiotics resistance protein